MNDLNFVYDVVERLAERGVHVWVFGGWAEQLLGLDGPRRHVDLDLLYPADSFDGLDAIDLPWLGGKRYAHKRAFAHDGVLCEVFLVQRDDRGHFTDFPGGRHRWARDVLWGVHGLRVAGPHAVSEYRAAFAGLRAA
jgi:Aminoglycoside-2''-adenylyltransferase